MCTLFVMQAEYASKNLDKCIDDRIKNNKDSGLST